MQTDRYHIFDSYICYGFQFSNRIRAVVIATNNGRIASSIISAQAWFILAENKNETHKKDTSKTEKQIVYIKREGDSNK